MPGSKDYQKQWRVRNHEYLIEQGRKRRAANRAAYNAKASKAQRKRMRTYRRELFALLGGKCERCGFDDERAFELHHPHLDGKADRRTGSYHPAYYKALIRKLKATPGSLVLLCANCHRIEHHVPDEA